jgi:hypothetical protein
VTGLVLVRRGNPAGGGRPEKLEREDDLGIEHRGRQSIDTLWVRRTGHCEHRATKTASGGGVNRAPKTGEASPKEQKRTRGHGQRAVGNTSVGAADPGLEKALRSTRRSPASSGNRRQEGGANGAKARATDEVVAVRSGEEAPGARNLDVAAG